MAFIVFASFNLGASAFLVGVLIASRAIGLTIEAWYSGKGGAHGDGPLGAASVGALVMGLAFLGSGVAAVVLRADLGLAVVAEIFPIGGTGNGVFNVAVRKTVHLLVRAGQHGRAFSFYVAVSRAAPICGHFGGGIVGAPNAIGAYLASGILVRTVAGLGWMVQKTAAALEGSIQGTRIKTMKRDLRQ